MQGIMQGFRVIGSGSKLGRDLPVTAYRFGGRVALDPLLEFIPDTNGERQRIQGIMKKSRLSLAEAKEKYPEWYERRIVRHEKRGRWTVKRDLYDWWFGPDQQGDPGGSPLLWNHDAGNLCHEVWD